MDSVASEKSIIALDGWLQTPAGLYVRAWEQQCLDSLTVDIFGFNAVQIGLPQLDALAASRMPNKWLLDARLPSRPPQERRLTLVSAFDELPFDSQSLDLVVLPHVLEFAAEPHQVLREVERVLIPEGRVIVCGFNPASLWGMRQARARMYRRVGVGGSLFLPESGEFISPGRLRDWLRLLGFELNSISFGCYKPSVRTTGWLENYEFMDSLGPRWWPILGAAYVIVAIKRVPAMRLLGPSWRNGGVKAPAPSQVPVANQHQGSTLHTHNRFHQE